MSHWAYHYLWLDAYVPIWPNIAASLIVAVWVVFRIKALEKLHIQHHKEHMAELKKIRNGSQPKVLCGIIRV